MDHNLGYSQFLDDVPRLQAFLENNILNPEAQNSFVQEQKKFGGRLVNNAWMMSRQGQDICSI